MKKYFILIIIIIVLFSGCTQQAQIAQNNKTNIVVPAYFYPSAEWDKLDTSVVIINPDSGPGNSIDQNYADAIKKLSSEKFGYVPTNYGSRPIDDIKSDIDKFNSFYGIKNIFLDEVPTDPSSIQYYQELRNYIIGKIILNPGAIPDEMYMGVGDIIVTFESNYNSYKSFIESDWIKKYPENRFWHIVHSAPDYILALNEFDKHRADYMYITDDVMPNPYDTLPSYWNDERVR